MFANSSLRTRILASCAVISLLTACESMDGMFGPEDSGPSSQTPASASHASNPGHMGTTPATTASAAAGVPMLEGLGTHTHKISTKVPETQAYFDQGVRLLFNFNHGEAIRAFEEGAKRDPNCAICYWGVAFAHGPNINMPMMPDANAPAYEAAQKAKALAPKASKAERAYINAIVKRYSNDPKADRATLDKAFAAEMRKVAKAYPNDVDAQVFYAESLMDTSPWNYWQADRRTPKPGLEELQPTLEKVIAAHPDHPGALHLYIHAMELGSPAKAEAAADRLKDLMPGAGHLVHMPTHIYNRVGRYEDAVTYNQKAAAADEKYFSATSKSGFYAGMYYVHNIHFVWTAATTEGRSKLALEHARKVVANVDPAMAGQMPPLEPFVSVALETLLRFGDWDQVLKEPAPSADLKQATAMWHYARARAYAAKGNLKKAKAEHAELVALVNNPAYEKHKGWGVPAKEMVDLAENIVAGDIAKASDDLKGAISQYREAVVVQDALPYTEPPYWDYPVRQQLGGALLEDGQAAEAEKIYREDLKEWPKNGWSLFGLWKSLEAQGKTQEAAAAKAEFDTAWQRADVKLDEPFYF
jgi:tetratricopeptide (TPR) repeat protein